MVIAAVAAGVALHDRTLFGGASMVTLAAVFLSLLYIVSRR